MFFSFWDVLGNFPIFRNGLYSAANPQQARIWPLGFTCIPVKMLSHPFFLYICCFFCSSSGENDKVFSVRSTQGLDKRMSLLLYPFPKNESNSFVKSSFLKTFVSPDSITTAQVFIVLISSQAFIAFRMLMMGTNLRCSSPVLKLISSRP